MGTVQHLLQKRLTPAKTLGFSPGPSGSPGKTEQERQPQHCSLEDSFGLLYGGAGEGHVDSWTVLVRWGAKDKCGTF